jgi:hypothetical protein
MTQKNLKRRLLVRDDLFVDQLSTVLDCDEAGADLDAQIKKIQLQLEKPKPWSDSDWVHRAVTAFAFKKAARIAVRQRREELLRAPAENRLHEVYARLAQEFMKRHPNECRVLARQIASEVK